MPTPYRFDYLVVGAGFAGSVLAERLASQLDQKVLICDRRPHVGGDAYDTLDEHGILIQPYGPHIVHTASARVFEYLQQFSELRPYEHRVLASVGGQLVPFPINITTLERLYGRGLTPEQAVAFLRERAEVAGGARTAEQVVVGRVGRELYETLFRNYAMKQWGRDPSRLDASAALRVRARLDRDDRYFLDPIQAMPAQGYTRLFENMLSHDNIRVMLGTDYCELASKVRYRRLIYTGPVDEYFEHHFGPLPYRSRRFELQTFDVERLQPVAVVTYPNDHAYTRVIEFKHLTGQQHAKTSVAYEYPGAEGDRRDPVPSPEAARTYAKYERLADATLGVHFVGRLATYRDCDMDQVIAEALATFDELRAQHGQRVMPVARAWGPPSSRSVSPRPSRAVASGARA